MRCVAVFTILALAACGGGSPPPGGNATCPATTTGPTLHGNDLRADEHWTADKSPHVVTQGINVYPGVTLTIDPCSTVQLAAAATIDVSGSLVAEGTATQRIQFMPKDAQPWAYMRFRAPGVSRLAYATVTGGGGGGNSGGPNSYHGTSLLLWGTAADQPQPSLKVTSVRVEHSAGLGVYLDTGGAFTDDSSDLTITQSGNATDPFPMNAEMRDAYSIPAGSYTGNVTDEIWIDQDLAYYTTSTALHIAACRTG